MADAAVEDARPLGSAQSLVWALYAQATVLEAGGDPAAAVRAGEEAVALTAGLEPSSIVAACGSALAAALVATGEGARATSVLLELQGGPDLPRFFAGQRAGCYEVLTRAALLTGDAAGRRGLGRARRGRARELPLAGALRAAGAGARAASPTATPRAPSRSRWSRSRPPTRSGSPSSPRAGASSPAARSPRRATATPRPSSCAPPKGLLVDAPAGHLRAEAVRELRRIGRRVNRAGRAGRVDAAGPAALTARELEIAQLVAGGLTNRAVAETLFLSEKTIESHLAGAFVKLGVRSRRPSPPRWPPPPDERKSYMVYDDAGRSPPRARRATPAPPRGELAHRANRRATEAQRVGLSLVEPGRERRRDLADRSDHAQPPHRQLRLIDQEHGLARLLDHGALELGLERVGVGEHAVGGDALDREEQPVGEVALDRAHGERADERAGEPAQRAADADHLQPGPALLEQQLHHRQRVGQHRRRQPGLDQPARDVVRRRRRVQEDRLARREQATAASASAVFSSAPTSSRRANESSCAEMVGSTAPPCVRRTTPRRSSSARSRRAVIGDTPKRSSSSATVTAPCRAQPVGDLAAARLGQHAGPFI